MTKRTVIGPFSVQSRGAGFWELTTAAPTASAVYLCGLRASCPELTQSARIDSLELEWRDDGVAVALCGEDGVRRLTVKTALVHEPRTRLYDSLPLAGFDARARRFWKRVFTLMRIPGGRLLLAVIARRKR